MFFFHFKFNKNKADLAKKRCWKRKKRTPKKHMVQVQHCRGGLEFVAHFRRESLCQDSFYIESTRTGRAIDLNLKSARSFSRSYVNAFENRFYAPLPLKKKTEKKQRWLWLCTAECSQSQFMIIRHRHTYDSEYAARVVLWFMHSRQYQSKCDIRFWHSSDVQVRNTADRHHDHDHTQSR